jgi:tetratricopeptide (TPR) repeat protein
MRPIAVAAFAVLCAVPLSAQSKPACDLSPGFFRLNSEPLNLKLAQEKPDQRDRMLAQVQDVAVRSILNDHQDQNPAAWYYLGRYYVETHNAVGAESTFARVEKLAPQCADSLFQYRTSVWTDAFGAGMSQWQGGKIDSAVTNLQLAHKLLPHNPRSLLQLGQLYASQNNVDSAVVYLKRGADVAGTDTNYSDARREALGTAARLTLARAQSDPVTRRATETKVSLDSLAPHLGNDSILLAHRLASSESRRSRGARLRPADQQAFSADSTQLQQSLVSERALRGALQAKGVGDSTALKAAYMPAVNGYRDLITAFPGSVDAAVNLAAIYSQMGHPELAATAFDPVIAHPEAADPAALLDAAQRLAAGGLGTAALRIYGAMLKLNPYNRNALAGQADAQLRLKNGPGAVTSAQGVVALDPRNQLALRALGQAWGLAGKADSSKKYLSAADSLLAVDITVTSFVPDSGGFTLTGVASNLQNTPSTPLRLTVEFLDAKGAVVATQGTDVAAIPVQGNAQFQVHARGATVVAWRYRVT